MSNSLKCTNPACQTFISVPEGAMQVICPNCNTWHFPSAQEETPAHYQTPISSGYDIPPSSLEATPNIQEEASPIAAAYVPPNVPLESAPPAPVTPNENETLAFLVTASGERLLLKLGKNLIGRKNTDLIIDDRTVSRKHCVIELIKNPEGTLEFFIYDVGHLEGVSSTNGVFISGRSLRLQDYERLPIGPGTAIKIGMVDLELKVPV